MHHGIARLAARGIGVIAALAFLAAPVSARTLGLVADDTTNSATVFDADTNTVLGSVPIQNGSAIGDVLVTPDQRLGFVTNFNYQVFVVDLTTPPPSLATGTNPIAIANHGEDLALSPDGRFLLVSNGSLPEPIAVIDIAGRTQIETFATGSATNALDVCDDGSVLDAAEDGVRRLAIDGNGVVTDTGETLSVANPMNVYCVPGSRSGVVVTWDGTVQSFALPGLAPVDSRPLWGAGISGVVSSAGDRVYVRSSYDGYVDAFSYDAGTGTLGADPLYTIPVDAATGFFGMEQMALNANANTFYVPQEGALGVYDARSGAPLTTITDPHIVYPTGVVIAPDICAGQPPAGAIVGTERNNRLVGTPGNDIIFGLGGNDAIQGQGGDDIICGGPGWDTITGGDGNDRIDGGDGNDTLRGNAGDDILIGGRGGDTLVGDAGSDVLDGGGKDSLFARKDSLFARDDVPGNDTADGGPRGAFCSADVGDVVSNCK